MKERRKFYSRRYRGLLLMLLAAVVLALGILIIRDVSGLSGDDRNYVVEIPDGAGTSAISKILHKSGIIEHPVVFKGYIKLKGEPVYQKGMHALSPSMSYGEIVTKLKNPPDFNKERERRIVIPEGYELRQIADLLAENGLIEYEAFMNEVKNGEFEFSFVNEIPRTENRLEGYLYPDTYMFSMDESEHDIINKMLTAFDEKVMPVYNELSGAYTLDQIIIMASVIEREAAHDEERSLVSSVFYNRIEKGMKLESCATVQYILKERKEILSNADTAIDSPYNTYMYKGLPVGPIASPGIKSIEAALKPAHTNYLYFLATSDGSRNLFSETFEEHNQKIQKIQG